MQDAITWKQITGFPDYEVSNTGLVRRSTPTHYSKSPRLISPSVNQSGYKLAWLYLSGKKYMRQVHRLVLQEFYGPSDLDVNHKDGNKQNNNLANLEYVTKSQNCLHREHELGKKMPHHKGEDSPVAKLTEADVHAIRSMRSSGSTYRHISVQFGISVAQAHRITHGVRWGHVSPTGHE